MEVGCPVGIFVRLRSPEFLDHPFFVSCWCYVMNLKKQNMGEREQGKEVKVEVEVSNE